MALIVVGGSGRGVGKTSLVCGLIASLPEVAFAAVKITTHAHQEGSPFWEDSASTGRIGSGTGTDTERYLAAGARRALLVASAEDQLASRLSEVRAAVGQGANRSE